MRLPTGKELTNTIRTLQTHETHGELTCMRIVPNPSNLHLKLPVVDVFKRDAGTDGLEDAKIAQWNICYIFLNL